MNLINKLKTLKDELLYDHPVRIEVIEQRFLGYELKSQSFKPNSTALKRAEVIQEAIDRLEKLKMVDPEYHYDDEWIEYMGV